MYRLFDSHKAGAIDAYTCMLHKCHETSCKTAYVRTNNDFIPQLHDYSPIYNLLLQFRNKAAYRCSGHRMLNTNDGKRRKEQVVGNLDAVGEDHAVLCFQLAVVERLRERPKQGSQGGDLPGDMAGAEKVLLHLGENTANRIPVDEAEVGEEDAYEDGKEDELIHSDLQSDGRGVIAIYLGIEPVIEIVAGGPMADEAKNGERDEAFDIEGPLNDEDL